ncbi:hypothetical protein TSUD_414850 [Trifolium subterraneum]|uniref:TIR domain-containing protein n=1 Tax=Trifolium subterraneum TaxID=3900 RepID=A0A1B5Z7E6_TRISU|nr:hypothetical protein TSUD_414850 [Trifolium subterraneum]
MSTMEELKSRDSSSFTYEWVYDVFLSFRGKDTRKGFTGNLYNALCGKGINAFIDDQDLRKGQEITPALIMAIQQSRIAIVIFSKNYASSTFCLEELTKIMECIKHNGRLVWPVFYKVDPSDVRHQKGSYAKALANHERKKSIDKAKVKQWRLALHKAGNLAGWPFKDGYEYKFIEKIIQEVSEKIDRRPLHVAKYPVGIESRVQKVNSLLEFESNKGAQMVGIYGMGGLGKTTLACAVYNCIADQFDSLCFLGDVRENSMKRGLVQLQEMLLLELAGEKDLKLCSLNKGISIIKSRLRGKKILLILDDVDSTEQLKALAGGLDWFGSGSRVIVTTRDRHLLHVYGIERVYEVEELKREEALELFAWNAFKIKEIDPSYVDISNRVVLYSNGLPLAVEIIGSDLCAKTKLEWKSALDTYEKIPHQNIQEILRWCGFAPDYAIQVLIDKSLIKVGDYRVRMHDMIEDMGREIVRLEAPSKPGERSRLWFSKDILHVFKENKGSNKTEILMLHLLKDKEVQWDGNALKNMENLKILEMKLSKCQSLKQVPDMSGAPNLKKLHLDSCKSLIKIHDSVGFLEKLEDINLNCCTSLMVLPHGINLPSLKTMSLRNCTTLENFPEILGKMENITYLVLSDSGICDLPFSIGLLVGLTNLTIDRCNKLLELPSSIFMLPKLETLEAYCCKGPARIKGEGQVPETIFSDVKNASSLLIQRDVDLSFCHLSCEFLATILPCLNYVTNLSLDYSSITILPSCINACHSLKKLTMDNCMELQEIRNLPPNIKHIKAINCTSLTSQLKEMLLNRMLLNSGIEYIIFPGSTIPSCFHQHTSEPHLSFRFRNKLPVMAICVVGVLGRCFLPRCTIDYQFDLIIDGNRQINNILNIKWYESNFADTNHIILLDVQLKAKFDRIGRLHSENGWTHAEFKLVKNGGKYMNLTIVHVREQIRNMPDIQFIDPEVPIKKPIRGILKSQKSHKV